MEKTYKGKLVELIREKNSRNGNPRFTAIIQDWRGFVTMATTAPDSSLGYSIRNYDGHWIDYQTKQVRGRLTLLSVEKAEINGEGKYFAFQFDQLPDSPTYQYKMQVRGCSDSGETGQTNWVNLTGAQLEKIREILVYGS